jgi:hypothetical protein
MFEFIVAMVLILAACVVLALAFAASLFAGCVTLGIMAYVGTVVIWSFAEAPMSSSVAIASAGFLAISYWVHFKRRRKPLLVTDDGAPSILLQILFASVLAVGFYGSWWLLLSAAGLVIESVWLLWPPTSSQRS